jgi:sugar phosphate isomerase/epimerase
MCTYPWAFADELAIWDELGVRQVGVSTVKLDAYGRDRAVTALQERSMTVTTITTRHFDLSNSSTWAQTQGQVIDAIDLASVVGGCVYLTPGRRDGRSFDELTASLSEAIAPCAAHSRKRNIRLAIEPSLRTDVSFVHRLADGLDVAIQANIDVIADLGNCWMERDYEDTVRRAGRRIAVVQFADAVFGSADRPPPGGRAVPGDGDLPIDDFIRATVAAGYAGPYELEMVGPLIEREGYAAALRRGVERSNALLGFALEG